MTISFLLCHTLPIAYFTPKRRIPLSADFGLEIPHARPSALPVRTHRLMIPRCEENEAKPVKLALHVGAGRRLMFGRITNITQQR
jgi:hypothetical protein